MTLEEIEKAWAVDSEIDNFKLDGESLKISKLHSKYYTILVHEKRALIKLKILLDEKEYIYQQFYAKTLTLEEIEHYGLLQLSDKKVLKPDIPKAVNSQPSVIDLKTRVGVQNIKIDFLESILVMIKNRNFAIRDAIEWQKFQAGGF